MSDSPLSTTHTSNGANFGQVDGEPAVLDYGNVHTEEQAARAGAGLIDLPHVHTVVLEGPDAHIDGQHKAVRFHHARCILRVVKHALHVRLVQAHVADIVGPPLLVAGEEDAGIETLALARQHVDDAARGAFVSAQSHVDRLPVRRDRHSSDTDRHSES